jgi:type I restriction enzyme S subunit
MNIQRKPLKAIAELKDSLHQTPEYADEGVPMVRVTDIRRGFLDLSATKRVDEATYQAFTKNYSPMAGDILFSRVGSYGNSCFVDRNERFCLGQNTVCIAPLRECVDPFYLYCCLNSDIVRDQIEAMVGGASQPTISLKSISTLMIPYPERSTQSRIASILSAYDDLIENNTRRIKILEDMAQMLYREWFVNFRFPGHEKVRMVESELGSRPDRWSVKPLGEVAAITMGLSPKGDTYNEVGDGLPLINGPVEFDERFTKAVKWTTAPAKSCKEGDLIVCVRGSTTGKYVKSDGIYCLGRGVCCLSSQYQSFVDLLFQHELPKLLAQTSGSTFPSWTGPQLKSHPVQCPPTDALERFEAVVRPMIAAVGVYSRRNRNLRTTRDFLLPKLISGEVPVEAAELVEQAV